MKIRVTINNQTFEVEIHDLSARPVQAVIDGEVFEVWPEGGFLSTQPSPSPARTVPSPAMASSPIASPSPAAPAPVSINKNTSVTAPIPGVIHNILVKAGEQVAVGQDLFVLEAMKMKNAIKASRVGTVASIQVNVGDTVVHGQTLLIYAE